MGFSDSFSIAKPLIEVRAFRPVIACEFGIILTDLPA